MVSILLSLTFNIAHARGVISQPTAPIDSDFICAKSSDFIEDLQQALRDRCEPGQPFQIVYASTYRFCCIARSN